MTTDQTAASEAARVLAETSRCAWSIASPDHPYGKDCLDDHPDKHPGVGYCWVRPNAQADALAKAGLLREEAPASSLGDRLRSAANYQDRPGAYDELRAMADESDRLTAARRQVQADHHRSARASWDVQVRAETAEAQVERVLALAQDWHDDGQTGIARMVRQAVAGAVTPSAPIPITADAEQLGTPVKLSEATDEALRKAEQETKSAKGQRI